MIHKTEFFLCQSDLWHSHSLQIINLPLIVHSRYKFLRDVQTLPFLFMGCCLPPVSPFSTYTCMTLKHTSILSYVAHLGNGPSLAVRPKNANRITRSDNTTTFLPPVCLNAILRGLEGRGWEGRKDLSASIKLHNSLIRTIRKRKGKTVFLLSFRSTGSNLASSKYNFVALGFSLD